MKDVDPRAIRKLEDVIRKRAKQLILSKNIRSDIAIKLAENEFLNAIYLLEYLSQNREFLDLSDTTVMGKSFDVIFSAICGLRDGWFFEKVGDITIISPKPARSLV